MEGERLFKYYHLDRLLWPTNNRHYIGAKLQSPDLFGCYLKAILHQTSSEVQGRVLYSVSGGPPLRGLPEEGEGISVNMRCWFTLAKAVQELTQCQILKASKGQKMKTVCERLSVLLGSVKFLTAPKLKSDHTLGEKNID